jgi:uncharacterized protein
MGRILFFVLLGVGLYVAFRIWRSGKVRDAAATGPRPADAIESMVRCAHCGLNVPQSEALEAGGRWFCSEAHRRLQGGRG